MKSKRPFWAEVENEHGLLSVDESKVADELCKACAYNWRDELFSYYITVTVEIWF